MSLPPEEAQKNVAAAEQAQKQRQHSGGNPLPVIFWLMVFGFVALSHFRRGAGRRYRTRNGGISPWVMLWGLNALANRVAAAAGAAARPGAVAAGAAAAAVASAASPAAAARSAAAERRRLMVMRLSDADREKVSAAIAAAEAKSNGEIVAVATPISDPYHDVALHWALVPLFAVLAWAAWRPTALVWWYDFLFGGWQPDPTLSQLLTLLMVFAALKFTVALLILKWMPLRLALTPGRDQAPPRPPPRGRDLQGCRRAPDGGTHRGPHLSFHGRAPRGDRRRRGDPEGHRRAHLGRSDDCAIAEVREGRPGDGIFAAIERVGVVLDEHFPRSAGDINEIPDKLIEL